MMVAKLTRYRTYVCMDAYLMAMASLALISMIALAIVYFAGYVPVMVKLDTETSKLGPVKQKYSQISQLARIESDVDKYSQYLNQLESRLSIKYHSAQVVRDMSSLLNQAGVSVKNMDYQKPRLSEKNLIVLTRLSIEGSYQGIRKVINGLDTLPFVAQIDELVLESDKGPLVSAQMQLKLRFRGEH